MVLKLQYHNLSVTSYAIVLANQRKQQLNQGWLHILGDKWLKPGEAQRAWMRIIHSSHAANTHSCAFLERKHSSQIAAVLEGMLLLSTDPHKQSLWLQKDLEGSIGSHLPPKGDSPLKSASSKSPKAADL